MTIFYLIMIVDLTEKILLPDKRDEIPMPQIFLVTTLLTLSAELKDQLYLSASASILLCQIALMSIVPIPVFAHARAKLLLTTGQPITTDKTIYVPIILDFIIFFSAELR